MSEYIDKVQIGGTEYKIQDTDTRGMIADNFSASSAYSAGDYVIYNDILYRFSADHAAGVWTGTDVSAVQLAEDVTDLKSAFNELGLSVVNGAICVSYAEE